MALIGFILVCLIFYGQARVFRTWMKSMDPAPINPPVRQVYHYKMVSKNPRKKDCKKMKKIRVLVSEETIAL